MILYGLKNCDTCRKARQMLSAAGHTVALRDVRDAPLSPEDLARFHAVFGADLVNRRSTTWRGPDAAARAGDPLDLLAQYPALMKRPLIEAEGQLFLGWDKAVQAALIGAGARSA
ncbi:MAG: arsenate reductase [Rhodobacteraceae bacterium]|nr:arsenate reductase [Paracoccaceae bacterium]